MLCFISIIKIIDPEQDHRKQPGGSDCSNSISLGKEVVSSLPAMYFKHWEKCIGEKPAKAPKVFLKHYEADYY